METKTQTAQLKTGILLINTGTPSACDIKGVRKYLREFLSDKRVIQLPRLLWLPILHGIVLRVRPKRSAHLYQKIWRAGGSPMRISMVALADKLAARSNSIVEIGMNYGEPNIETALTKLVQQKIDRLIILPLFPQYSLTSTASSYDRVFAAFKKLHQYKLQFDFPQTHYIAHYADHDCYIETLAKNIKRYWKREGGKSQHLLISFHGVPKRYVQRGDPYETHCRVTANALAEVLQLQPQEWTLCYQSQFGYDKWLQPSTQSLFVSLPKNSIKTLDIVCPGFAVDCLETLEEIAITGKKAFLAAGGERFHYIPALNEEDIHIEFLAEMLAKRLI